MWKAMHDHTGQTCHIHHMNNFGATSQSPNKQLTSTAEETPKGAALKFGSNADLEPSEAYTELLIFLLTKNKCPTNKSMGASWWWLYVLSFAYK